MPHLGIALVEVRLDEVGNGTGHVTEMDFPEFAHLGEGSRSFKNILAGALAALHPCSAAETDSDIWRVGNLESPHVSVERAEDVSRDAAQFRNRRIIGMDSDTHSCFLGNRGNLTDEVCVVVPEFLFRILASMCKRALVDLAVPGALRGGQVERP